MANETNTPPAENDAGTTNSADAASTEASGAEIAVTDSKETIKIEGQTF